jgi:hypothetical protein
MKIKELMTLDRTTKRNFTTEILENFRIKDIRYKQRPTIIRLKTELSQENFRTFDKNTK